MVSSVLVSGQMSWCYDALLSALHQRPLDVSLSHYWWFLVKWRPTDFSKCKAALFLCNSFKICVVILWNCVTILFPSSLYPVALTFAEDSSLNQILPWRLHSSDFLRLLLFHLCVKLAFFHKELLFLHHNLHPFLVFRIDSCVLFINIIYYNVIPQFFILMLKLFQKCLMGVRAKCSLYLFNMFSCIHRYMYSRGYNMDKPWKQYATWQKADTKAHILYESIDMKCAEWGNS